MTTERAHNHKGGGGNEDIGGSHASLESRYQPSTYHVTNPLEIQSELHEIEIEVIHYCQNILDIEVLDNIDTWIVNLGNTGGL